MPLRIRPATLVDAPAMLALYLPYVLGSPVTFELEPPSEAEFVERVSEKEGKFPWLVAEESGELVGYAYGAPFRARRAYDWSVESSVYVRQGSEGRGIGRELYRGLLPVLERQGVVNVIGGLTLPNEASRKLHEHFGFRPVAHLKDAGYKMGRWWDVGYWQLQFAKPDRPAPLRAPDYS